MYDILYNFVIKFLGSVDGAAAASSLGRGAMRGRRVLPANIITRPTTLESKQGLFYILKYLFN